MSQKIALARKQIKLLNLQIQEEHEVIAWAKRNRIW